MNSRFHKVTSRHWTALLLLSLLSGSAHAKTRQATPLVPLTPAQAALINQAIAREKVTVTELRKRIPIVQTYIQNMKPDPTLASVPKSDVYMLSRVDFGKTFQAD